MRKHETFEEDIVEDEVEITVDILTRSGGGGTHEQPWSCLLYTSPSPRD